MKLALYIIQIQPSRSLCSLASTAHFLSHMMVQKKQMQLKPHRETDSKTQTK